MVSQAIKMVIFHVDDDENYVRGAQRVVEDFTEMVVEARRQIIIILITNINIIITL